MRNTSKVLAMGLIEFHPNFTKDQLTAFFRSLGLKFNKIYWNREVSIFWYLSSKFKAVSIISDCRRKLRFQMKILVFLAEFHFFSENSTRWKWNYVPFHKLWLRILVEDSSFNFRESFIHCWALFAPKYRIFWHILGFSDKSVIFYRNFPLLSTALKKIFFPIFWKEGQRKHCNEQKTGSSQIY